MRGTVHISQSDFSLLYPHVCSLFLKTTANPRRALDLNINTSLEFLKLVMPHIPPQIRDAFPREGILNQKLSKLDEIPTSQLHRPKEKFTASRLRIRHEFLWRTAPALARRKTKEQIIAEGGEVGKEVWVHTKPSEEKLKAYQERRHVDQRHLDASKDARESSVVVPS